MVLNRPEATLRGEFGLCVGLLLDWSTLYPEKNPWLKVKIIHTLNLCFDFPWCA